MRKDKMSTIRDFIVGNAKFVFPVIVIAVVAVTVSIALKARNASAGEESSVSGDESTPGQESGAEVLDGVQTMQQIPEASEEVPLLPNENDAIHSVIASYYDAMLTGDRTVLTGMYDSITENELLRYEENAKYLDHFTELDVYTKAGLTEDATLVQGMLCESCGSGSGLADLLCLRQRSGRAVYQEPEQLFRGGAQLYQKGFGPGRCGGI